jgi:DNA ligase 1
VETLLTRLSGRTITGNEAIAETETVLDCFDGPSQQIILKILDRDLVIGCSESTINKAIPNLIPTFNVALAKSYDDKTKKNVLFDGSWYASRKLDGCRCIAIKQNGYVKFFSRQGKEFLVLNNVNKALVDISIPDGTVLDGEICLMDSEGNEDFQGIMKQIRKKDHTIPNPMYVVFDMLTTEEFQSQTSKRTLTERQSELKEYITGTDVVTMLEQIPLTEEAFQDLQNDVQEYDWEGLILRKDCQYKGKRSNELLKVKKFHDAEYTIVDTSNSTMTQTEKGVGQVQYEGMDSVTIMHEGCAVQVGSGWSIEQRKHFAVNPQDIIGKVITVQYFEITTDKNGKHSLRFPTLKHIHGDKREV